MCLRASNSLLQSILQWVDAALRRNRSTEKRRRWPVDLTREPDRLKGNVRKKKKEEGCHATRGGRKEVGGARKYGGEGRGVHQALSNVMLTTVPTSPTILSVSMSASMPCVDSPLTERTTSPNETRPSMKAEPEREN